MHDVNGKPNSVCVSWHLSNRSHPLRSVGESANRSSKKSGVWNYIVSLSGICMRVLVYGMVR